MLQNKEGIWMSNDLWNFKSKDDLIYIENISKSKVLGFTNDMKVTLVKKGGKTEQLWRQGVPNAEGYFTLENSEVPKVITAISSSVLEIKGKITLR